MRRVNKTIREECGMDKTPKIVLWGIVAFSIGIVLFILIQNYPTILEKIHQEIYPDVEVLDTEGFDHMFGFDYGYIVHVTLHNKGKKGAVLVTIDLLCGAEQWTKSQTVYIKHDQIKKATFEFLEPKLKLFGPDKCYYRVTVVVMKR